VWTLVLAVAYAGCVWWSTRGASSAVRRTLLLAVAVGLALRLLYPLAFPWGYHEDELLVAIGALQHYCDGQMLGTLRNNLQAPLYAATVGPAMLYVGVWAVRAYAMLATLVAIPLAYGVAQLAGVSAAAALGAVVPAFVAMPWALLYGRTGIGGEAILHLMVVVLALVHLVRAEATRAELLAAWGTLAGGLFLCCVSYTAAKVALLAPAAAVLCLPPHRRALRLLALATATAAAALAYHRIALGPYAWYGFDASTLPPEQQPLARLGLQFPLVWRSFWEPVNTSATSQSVSFVQMVPWPLLLCALIGLPRAVFKLRGVRLLFLVFLLGLLPAVLGPSNISNRRLLLAGMCVPFLVAAGIDLVPPDRWRLGLAVAVAVITIGWGVRSYFTPAMWLTYDRGAFCALGCALQPPGSDRGLPLRCPTCTYLPPSCMPVLPAG
jgi:hypothetical protein